MKRHAYLIIAHNEFEILIRLISALDDKRNDIYVHFDKKVENVPLLETAHARLFIIEDRIDVRWGDSSQIKCEFILFKSAYKNGPYSYYHTLSGVDIPLKSQSDIHKFCDEHQGKEFIGFAQGNIEEEVDRKVRRIHLFSRNFRCGEGFICMAMRMLRGVFLRLQICCGIHRNQKVNFKKGSSWVSVTHDFVGFLLPKYQEVMDMYRHSFCADEIFLHTICWDSGFKYSLYDDTNEMRGSMRMIGWHKNQLVDWTNEDFETLISSEAFFARKFNSRNIDVVDRILNTIL